MIKRLKYVLGNENGSIMLEEVILISVFVLISVAALYLMFKFKQLAEAQSGYATTTGWFRTDNTNGMKN